MAGIYLHIPFCKQACHYCNFHFSTSLNLKQALLEAIHREILLQKDYLQGSPIKTIYFGGGTPSLLSPEEISRIIATIRQYQTIETDAEITLEANPDDLSPAYLEMLRSTPINRLSIGIQSFSEDDLRWMNRAHNAVEARNAIEYALKAGFHNLTADLIYGIPSADPAQWEKNLAILMEYPIPHISSYCLTVEEGTALHHFIQKKKTAGPDESAAVAQFDYLVQTMSENGFEHYEISNFARPGFYAKHNTGYWKGVPYLGIGPSAHSFDGSSRQWNVANNPEYIKSLGADLLPFEREVLTPVQQYNEYVMTSLRTMWGTDLEKVGTFGAAYRTHFLKNIQSFLDGGKVYHSDGIYTLTANGKFLADGIIAALFAG